jgi:hypothetical protein
MVLVHGLWVPLLWDLWRGSEQVLEQSCLTRNSQEAQGQRTGWGSNIPFNDTPLVT